MCCPKSSIQERGVSARVVHVQKGGQPNAHSMHTWGEGGSKKAEILHTYYVHSPYTYQTSHVGEKFHEF